MTAAQRSDGGARALALVAAFLAGASGLGLQSLLISASGLALGYGGSVAIGLAAWLCAWALGAGLARRRGVSQARALAIVGLALLLVAPASTWALLFAGRALGGGAEARAIAIVALALPALLQGVFLPVLARGFERVGWLFATNLVGCVAGAYWIADRAVGSGGRMSAAWIAGGTALLAALCGVMAARGTRAVTPSPSTAFVPLSAHRAAVLVALGTAWMSGLEWISFRLGVLWLGGMQNALNAVLCASLVGLALGAAVLPPLLRHRRHAVLLALIVCAACSMWPFLVATPLAALSGRTLLERALVLCVPAMLGFGALVPIVHARCGGGEDSGERLGRLLASEAAGALIGIPIVHFVVVPHFGLSGAIAFVLVLGAVAMFVVSRPVALPVLALAVLAAFQRTPALVSAPYSNPALTVLSLREDRDFAVGVVDDGMQGERTLLTDGFRAAGTGRDYLYMQALGHLPVLLHPEPKRVAVLALGTGTTVGAVALHDEVERIDVLEISRAVVEAAPYFVEKNHGALAEGLPGLLDENDAASRVVVRLGDGRATLAGSPDTYDVITMEPLLPDSPFAVYLYTREFYAIARRALKPGGLVCQWVPPHALEPATFYAVSAVFRESFAHSSAWVFGTQVILVGGDRQIAEPTAERFVGGTERLREALAVVGLSTSRSLAGHWCSVGVPLGPARDSERKLSDADPFIVFRPRRRGSALLLDLPLNLQRIEEEGQWVEDPFQNEPDAERVRRREGHRALRAARVALAFREAERGRAPAEGSTSASLSEHLSAARSRLGSDPDLERFEDEVRFLDELRAGVAALASSSDRAGAEIALGPLITAAELRPERADVHLYAAIALERLGSPAAVKALARALQNCPRLALTPEAVAARRWTMSDEMWRTLVEASASAHE